MILSVKLNKTPGKTTVTDLESGNTWSKENIINAIYIIEKNNLISELKDSYTALKEAYTAIQIAEQIKNNKESEDIL